MMYTERQKSQLRTEAFYRTFTMIKQNLKYSIFGQIFSSQLHERLSVDIARMCISKKQVKSGFCFLGLNFYLCKP